MRTWWFVAVVSAWAGMAGAAQPIPIETLFRAPEYERVVLSPDGTQIAAIIPIHGHQNLAVVDLTKMEAHAITGYNDQDVVNYIWVNNRRLLVDVGHVHDASGLNYITAYGAVDVDGSNVQSLPFGTRSVLFRYRDDSGDVLVTGRRGASSAVFRASTLNGRQTLVTFENPGDVTRWVVDWDGNVRGAMSYDRKTQSRAFHYRATGDGPWKELARFGRDENAGTVPLAFDSDNHTLFVTSNVGTDRAAVYRYDPDAAKTLDKVLDSSQFDVAGLVLDRKGRRVVGIQTGDTPSGVTWLDDHWKGVQAAVDKALPGLVNRVSAAGDKPDLVLVTSGSSVQPTRFWLLDLATSRMVELQNSRKWIDVGKMTPVRRVSYKARDGLEIPAYLAIPPRAQPGKPPLVVVIHGGPHTGGYRGWFDEETQFFASRGYAVLYPNFRGTTGYGRKFLEAGHRQWGRAMQDDITDGVKWLVDQGLVDPERVCLFGHSYGGYAALMGLVREPSMFRCAVAGVAVTDPALLFEPGWNRSVAREDVEDYLKRTIGDINTQRAWLDEVSPLKRAADIRKPVLLAFGGADRRVPLVHGTRLRSALESNGAQVEWVMYPDEAHGFTKDENRFDFYHRVETFLARNLGS